ncbi:MAG: hypothetical protein ACK4NN_16775 [Rheinheimera sp.]
MKGKMTLSAAVGLFVPLLFSLQLQAHQLEGSWQLMSGEVNEQGQPLDYAKAKMQGVKIVSGNQFSFISHKDGKFYAAAAGSIKLEGQNYSETPLYASYAPMIGETYRFVYRLDGDLWHNERFADGKLVERETWKRLP